TTRVDQSRCQKLAPSTEVKRAAVTLPIRTEWTTDVGAFTPLQSKPREILEHRVAKFRPAPLWIQILDSQDQRSVVIPGTLLCLPESQRMTDVQVTGWGRRDSAAVPNDHRRNFKELLTQAKFSPPR